MDDKRQGIILRNLPSKGPLPYGTVSATYAPGVYRYDYATGTLSLLEDHVPVEDGQREWFSSYPQGPGAPCWSPNVAGVRCVDGVAVKSNRRSFPQKTVGQYCAAAWPLRSGRLAAVVSADGPVPPNYMPFLASPKFQGQAYLQIYNIDTGHFFGETLHLPFRWGDGWGEACGSPDDRFVMFYDFGRRTQLVFAPTGQFLRNETEVGDDVK